ncbi:hypothetical protein bwei_4867 [Bacillus mycoides]|nr:hypothetical protein bwei_4867 [Bacillus mycoides]OSY05519.1 hypothetical protein S2E19_00935 [Bacillus mycoides]
MFYLGYLPLIGYLTINTSALLFTIVEKMVNVWECFTCQNNIQREWL